MVGKFCMQLWIQFGFATLRAVRLKNSMNPPWHWPNMCTQWTGIPLEYEATYHCIAFLPSRMHSGGSLTKYWAYGNEGMKIRGLELRQHSTCVWIARLQKQALHILADTDDLVEGIPSYRVQSRIQRLLLDAINQLEQLQLFPRDLIITQRISRKPTSRSPKTVAMVAYRRSKHLGFSIEMASKFALLFVKKTS